MSVSGGNKVDWMAIRDWLIGAAALITAIGVIVGVFLKIYRPIKSVLEKLDRIDKHQTENYIATLRLTIMSEEMPLEERIAAGDKYIEMGGNGAVKHKYEQLLKQLDKERTI